MKKIFLICLSLLAFASCKDEDDFDVNDYTGDEQTYFTDLSLNREVAVSQTSDSDVSIAVGSTVTSNSDRTYGISIDETSTAVEGDAFTLSSSTVTIPAGEYVGYVTVSPIFDGIDGDNGSTVVLNLVDTGNFVSTFSNQVTITLTQQCDASFESSIVAGMYSVTTNYVYHDFLPDFNPNTATFEVVDLGDNMFSVSDFSGGLYSVGPYASAYGTGGVDNTLVFTDECNKIVWEGQTDPWGDILPQDGGVNSVDPSTGVITISWYCTGYGEEGVSVYTPL